MSFRSRSRWLLPALFATPFLAGSGIAFAGIGSSATPLFPSDVTVGDTLTVEVDLSNQNTGADTTATNTVCSHRDPLPCPADDPGITLIPSCGQLAAFSACAPAGADPGVFRAGHSAFGVPGTACAGMEFLVSEIDPVFGRLRIAPASGNHVQLPGAGSRCVIRLTMTVVKAPTVDQNPFVDGVQTVQIADNTQYSANLTASARGTTTGLTVHRATPTISTVAGDDVQIGGSVADTASVAGRVEAQDGATVRFDLYGPDDSTCSRPPAFTSTVPLNAGGEATSEPFTPQLAGTYRWVATYSGDANNEPVAGPCGDPAEMVEVTKALPSIQTVASPTVARGKAVYDTAQVRGLVNPLPGATVTFRLYTPGDLACLMPPVFTSTVPLNADGTAVSQTVAPAIHGTYRWVATYNGDANNQAVSGDCSDPSELVVITPVDIPGSNTPIPVVS